MKREVVSELLPAMQHFASGGDLWYCTHKDVWVKQKDLVDWHTGFKIVNIIEDKHFEMRKAKALGAEIEQLKWSTSNWGEFESFHEDGVYRIKDEEIIYEWQWTYKPRNHTSHVITGFYTLEEAQELTTDTSWVKILESERVRR